MDLAKELVLALKQKNTSHVGYGLQKECEALIGHILQNMGDTPFPAVETEIKNEEDSIRYREEGNQYFVMGEDYEAIKCYTKSLAYADTKEFMAYAHANRSAALYRKQLYKECLVDIDAALDLGYPEEKRRKLKERGAKALEEIRKLLKMQKGDLVDVDKFTSMCMSEQDEYNSLIVRYRNGNTIQNGAKAEDSRKDEISNIDAIDDKDLYTKKEEKKPRYLANEGLLQLTYGPNKEAPATSAGTAIVFNEKYGRHLVATKEFKPGEVITIEDPYAHIIYVERYYTHCHQCLSRSYNLIPCLKCPVAQYCSDKCRKIAWEVAHEIECPILALLTNLLNVDKDKIRILTKIMRLLIVATAKGTKLKELREDMKIAEMNPVLTYEWNDPLIKLDNRVAGFTDKGIFDSSSARSALSLATNMTTRPLVGISAFACISALGAILLATQTNFFCKKYGVDQLKDVAKLPDVIFAGSLMFRGCVIMSSNCFSVQQEPGIPAGSGLYVVHSLYNHSCAPNTFRHFEDLTMITRALKPIAPGEQIFTSYGGVYAYMVRSERREKIMQDYFFECDCPACSSDWPLYCDILKNHIGSISKNKELVEKLKPYKKRLMINMYDIDAVKNVLCILYKEVSQPCEEIVHAEQYLKSYYLDP